MDRERYATMSDEKRIEGNKKRHERYKMNSQGLVDSSNTVVVHSIGMIYIMCATLKNKRKSIFLLYHVETCR
jgi:hypothetical protein